MTFLNKTNSSKGQISWRDVNKKQEITEQRGEKQTFIFKAASDKCLPQVVAWSTVGS